MMDLNSVLETLAESGFLCLGTAKPEPPESSESKNNLFADMGPVTSLLIGNVGHEGDASETSRFWEAFSASPECNDGFENPMDRWTRRIVSETTAQLAFNITVLFPFDGPPWAPFVSWAMQSGTRFYKSPLGMAIHKRYGLWCGFRAALIVPDSKLVELEGRLEIDSMEVGSPCLECQDKPCLTHCPVSAFSSGQYDVTSCRNHLDTVGKSSSTQDCTTQGCSARLACPIGRPSPLAQRQFHMSSFWRSR